MWRGRAFDQTLPVWYEVVETLNTNCVFIARLISFRKDSSFSSKETIYHFPFKTSTHSLLATNVLPFSLFFFTLVVSWFPTNLSLLYVHREKVHKREFCGRWKHYPGQFVVLLSALHIFFFDHKWIVTFYEKNKISTLLSDVMCRVLVA